MSTWTGPGRPVRAMWNASLIDLRQVLSVADEVVLLGDRDGDARDVRFLEGVRADHGGGHVA